MKWWRERGGGGERLSAAFGPGHDPALGRPVPVSKIFIAAEFIGHSVIVAALSRPKRFPAVSGRCHGRCHRMPARSRSANQVGEKLVGQSVGAI